MIFLKNDKIDLQKWYALFNISEFATPFQMPEFYQFCQDSTGYNAQAFAMENEGIYKALVVVTIQKEEGIKSYFSKRGIVFGGPLLENITTEELIFFLNEVSSHLNRKVIYIETRNFFDYSPFTDAFKRTGWIYEPYFNFRLSLETLSKESLMGLFTSGRRREIKQSMAEGASYSRCIDSGEISQVYEILKELYNQRVKLPLPALEYFIGLHNHRLIQVFIVKHSGQIIGGSFCPTLPGKAIYTYYYCGLRDYNKKIFPTHLAVYAAMEYAIENRIPVIDFMGAGKPGIKYGVREYKAQFGGDLVEYGRWKKILNPTLYNLGVWGLGILKKL
jgi:hypothetical protein